jgi:alpha/beta hydrolase fold
MPDLSLTLIATAIVIATAMVLFAAAVLSLSLARRAEERRPSSGRFLTVNGVRLHHTDSGGSGVPVVLIHGNTVTFEDWQLSGVSAKTEQRYRVIAFDRPGFGYSERPRLKLWSLVAASGYYFPTFRLDALMVAPRLFLL